MCERSIHRLLPGPGSPMPSSLSKSDLHYGDYGLQHHGLHHDSMYYNPPVYQVGDQSKHKPAISRVKWTYLSTCPGLPNP